MSTQADDNKKAFKLKGNNTLLLCQSSMVRICQFWVNNAFPLGAEVTGVFPSRDETGLSFEIRMTDTPEGGEA